MNPSPSLQLKFYGRRCVLEQALRVGDSPGRVGREFAKILLASKSFLLENKTWKIYSFAVGINDQTYFAFEDFSAHHYTLNADRCTSLTVEKARRVMKLLNPSFAAFYVNNDDQTYLQLLDLAGGQIALYFNDDFDFAQDLVNQYWPRLYGLWCVANAIRNLPRKEFHHLAVSVRNTDEMRSTMRHDTKILKLIFLGDFLGDVEEFQEVGKIQHCAVRFALGDGFLNFIRNLKMNCKDVKSLAIESKGESHDAHEVDLAGILFVVEELCRRYSQAVTEFLNSPAKVNVKVQLEIGGDDFTFPPSWMMPLLTREDFGNVHHQTSGFRDQVTTVFSNGQAHNNLEAKFNAELNYQFGDEQMDVDSEDSDDHSESDEDVESDEE